jgi:small subunit ribosomal protein S5
MAREGGSGRIDDVELVETVVKVKPVSKVTRGGRDRRFNALVVVGDRRGRVGVGLGKAREVSEAIRKGTQIAQRSMARVSVGSTIPHEIWGRCGAARIFLRPATPGTGLIAGSAARAVLEAAGVQNVLSKSIGSTNAHNVAQATLDALTKLRTYAQVRAQRRLMPEKAAEEAAPEKPEAVVTEQGAAPEPTESAEQGAEA